MKAIATSVGATLAVGSLVFGAAGVGCAMDTDVDDENVGTVSQAVTTTDYTDASGLVTIRVKTCNYGTASQFPTAVCVVDSGFVLVGGGAEVEGTAPGGGLLVGSWPASRSIWGAASKDHMAPHVHRIRAYAVGMKLSGMAADKLYGLVRLTQATSAPSQAPSVTVSAPVGDVVLSGGALASDQGNAQLLTGSFPTGSRGWTASAKDHQAVAVASVTAFVMSVPMCLNNQWADPVTNRSRCLWTSVDANSTSVPSGYALATINTPSGYAPVGVGGRARWSGWGRLLTDLFPTNSVGGKGATAYSKDHNFAEANITDVWAISIQGGV